jgi:hypothetical protein
MQNMSTGTVFTKSVHQRYLDKNFSIFRQPAELHAGVLYDCAELWPGQVLAGGLQKHRSFRLYNLPYSVHLFIANIDPFINLHCRYQSFFAVKLSSYFCFLFVRTLKNHNFGSDACIWRIEAYSVLVPLSETTPLPIFYGSYWRAVSMHLTKRVQRFWLNLKN